MQRTPEAPLFLPFPLALALLLLPACPRNNEVRLAFDVPPGSAESAPLTSEPTPDLTASTPPPQEPPANPALAPTTAPPADPACPDPILIHPNT